MLDCLELIYNYISVSALAAPAPPAGFETGIYFDTSKKFNPLAVYLCALDTMYKFAQTGWSKVLVGGITIWVERFNVQIDIESEGMAHGSTKLETSHIVLGLYQTMVEVAARSHFCETLTTLTMHGRQIGRLIIEKRTQRTVEGGGSDAINLTLVEASPQGNAVTYPSGHFIDPDDPDFSISYTYSGARINSKDIFLAVLDALATSAQFSPLTPFSSLSIISPSGDCAVNIVGIDGGFPVNYSFVTKTLRIVVMEIMVKLGKFEEIELQLKYEDFMMASASFKLADRGTIAQQR